MYQKYNIYISFLELKKIKLITKTYSGWLIQVLTFLYNFCR